MIISDSEAFVFVHNPKVGGMTFRTALSKFDTRDNFFFEWKTVGEAKKQLDMAHITPFQLRKFFPEVFKDIRDYYKFGFVRNPYTRFLSAVSQHLKLSTPYTRSAMLGDAYLFYQFANSFAVNALKEEPIENDHRLVHFRRQSNFLFLDNAQWVNEFFLLEKTDTIQGSRAAPWLGDAARSVKNQTSQLSETGYDLGKLSVSTVEKINDFYSIDFERFGYERL